MIERFVIFGASGDLTSRLLLPALSHLVEAGSAPGKLAVTGVGVRDSTTDAFRSHIREALAAHAGSVSSDAREAVVATLSYEQGDVTVADDVRRLVDFAGEPVLVYLALPPRLFEPALRALSSASLPQGSAIAIEKPFGDGVESARALNRLIASGLPGIKVFRVDHFLSDALVQNVVALRFANRLYEPLWSSDHIARVEITWDETLALEGRAGYYDQAGALRDMLQNHLLEALTLVAMEPPARIEESYVRDARAAVLAAIPSPRPEELAGRSARGRYTAGKIGDRAVPAYVDEEGVDPARSTETLAELTLEIANWRWEGVPFRLRSGKALARDRAEIAIHFRPVPRSARIQAEPNVLRIGLMEPYVRAGVNVLGPERSIVADELELCAGGPELPAYANLLLDMLNGDPMLSIRGDEAEEAWRIVAPVLAGWEANRVPMLDYPAGSSGPEEMSR
ncbi:MAG: glucose-6-phosphate dehydrogenase [Solirubrobacterales bacterium]